MILRWRCGLSQRGVMTELHSLAHLLLHSGERSVTGKRTSMHLLRVTEQTQGTTCQSDVPDNLQHKIIGLQCNTTLMAGSNILPLFELKHVVKIGTPIDSNGVPHLPHPFLQCFTYCKSINASAELFGSQRLSTPIQDTCSRMMRIRCGQEAAGSSSSEQGV